MAESVIGLLKTEVIRKAGPWRGIEDVEFATLEWVWRFNHHRLLGPIGYRPPVELEESDLDKLYQTRIEVLDSESGEVIASATMPQRVVSTFGGAGLAASYALEPDGTPTLSILSFSLSTNQERVSGG